MREQNKKSLRTKMAVKERIAAPVYALALDAIEIVSFFLFSVLPKSPSPIRIRSFILFVVDANALLRLKIYKPIAFKHKI